MFLKNFNRISDLTFRQILQHLTDCASRKVARDGFDPPPSPCVFTLSTGRTGTKSLAALAGLAKNILAFHEPLPKLYRLSFLYYSTPYEEKNAAIFREALLMARSDRFRYACSFKKGYLETSPQVTFLAPIILNAVTDVKFIHITRDPRDYVRSGMRRRWYVDHPMDNTRIAPPCGSDQGRAWPSFTPFEKIIWLWKETNTWIDRFLFELPPERVLRLRSEDVFVMNPTTIDRYFRFIDSRVPSAKRIKRVLSKHLNAQSSGDFPKYSQWSSEMRRYLTENIGYIAADFGYQL